MSTLRAKAPIHKNRNTTMNRISGYLSTSGVFETYNLPARLYSDTVPFKSIHYWSLPGGAAAWQGYTFQEIIQQDFQPVVSGQRFGPTWSTHWFRIVIEVPTAWTGKEIHLRWATESEATLWTENGQLLQGMSPEFREEYLISKSWSGSTADLVFYMEMACNSISGINDIMPPPDDKYYTINMADIAVFDRTVFKLLIDLDMLYQIANQLGAGDHISYQAMFAANEMVTLIKDGEEEAASSIADGFFAEQAGSKMFTLYAIGQCHIDCAWLWPYSETIRKCARSFSAQLGLIDEYSDFTFTHSTAQQFAWVKDYYPEFYEKVKQAVLSGKFEPVGAVWVEMDGNLPSGETFIRQFFYGQRFYQDEFGLLCKEFWMPDTFGYSAQIPQIIKHVGIDRFMTTKMSWNLVNKFPNNNFWWEGLDGSTVLVHLPAGLNYQVTLGEVMSTKNGSEDKGRANLGMFLFGRGDGGGGPTRTMIERLRRLRNVDGIPKTQISTADTFWRELDRESHKFYKYVGELYLELHNGTYTSQAKIKWYNRKCEFFFREVEQLFSMAYISGKITQAKLNADVATLDTHWKNFLLNQFHDILPGSCIEMATMDAWAIYEEVFTALMQFRTEYNALLLSPGTARILFNPLNWSFKTVIFHRPDSGSPPTGANIQAVNLETSIEIEEATEGRYRVPSQFSAALVQMNASGYSEFAPLQPTNPVVYTSGQFNNGLVRLQFPLTGLPVETLHFTGPSGTEKAVYSDRLQTGTQPAMLYIYDDVPLYWDAWDVMDYHLETHKPLNLTTVTSPVPFATTGGIVGGYKWTGSFGNSTFERYTFIRADSPMVEYYLIIDWHENHKFLKVEFPVDVLAREATFETQFGHLARPTHINTSWDMAKFEVCGHKWMDISQADKGVTFITDAKYGWHVRDNIVQLSLLRSPKNPDENCDMHRHYIHYAICPHEGRFQEAEMIQRAYEFNFHSANNVPLLTGSASDLLNNWITVSSPAVIVEACKTAHDVPGSVVIRLYEAFGGNVDEVTISLGFPVLNVNVCNGLEVIGEPVQHSGNTFTTNFTSFQIKSFMIQFQ